MMFLTALVLPVSIFAIIIFLELGIIKAYHRIRTSSYAEFAWIVLFAIFVINFALIYISALMLDIYSLIFVVPFACIGLVYYYWIGDWPHASTKEKGKNHNRLFRITTQISVGLIILSHVFPYFGYFGIRSYCFWQNSQLAEPIIEAVENYRAENGVYPRLSWLVPDYLGKVPEASCQVGSEANRSFFLDSCYWGNYESVNLYVLSYPTLGYSFETKTWSTIDFNIHPCSVMDGLD